MNYLYLKTHETGLKYLGKTKADPFKYKGSGTTWTSHLKEHGNNVTTEILFQTEDMEEFKEVALSYSHKWNVVESPEFANRIHEKGTAGGGKPSEEGKQALREAREKYPNGMLGKEQSDYQKQQTSLYHKGRVRSDEQKAKMSKAFGKVRWTCLECGMESLPHLISKHQRVSGHTGVTKCRTE